jgi:hypothetical protein
MAASRPAHPVASDVWNGDARPASLLLQHVELQAAAQKALDIVIKTA